MWSSWRPFEKRQLLKALKKHGSSDLTAISDEMPFKSIEEIRLAINYYETRAINSLKTCDESKQNRKSPLDSWKDLFKNFADPYAKAMKYITLFERRTTTEDVNLDHCYQILTSLMHGSSPKATNPETAFFLYSTFVKIVQTIKKRHAKVEKEFIKNATVSCYTTRKTYELKKKSSRLLNNSKINILNIPPKFVEMDKDLIL